MSGLHETPYQLLQHLVPVHVLNMPIDGSRSADLKAMSAERSDGGQAKMGGVRIRIRSGSPRRREC